MLIFCQHQVQSGKSRFDADLGASYIPPRVLTLRINRPETVPGRFSRIRINEDLTEAAKSQKPQGDDDQADAKDGKDTDQRQGTAKKIWHEICNTKKN